MLRFGPGGIPLSCKGRTHMDGVEDVHVLGLNALEAQFVRVNLYDRYVSEEEIGQRPKEVPGELIVGVFMEHANGGLDPLPTLDARLERGNIIRILSCGIAKNYLELRDIGAMASDLDVKVSLHAPYYSELTGNDELAMKSAENIKMAGLVAHHLGADTIVTHQGFYNGAKDDTLQTLTERLREISDWYRRHHLRPRIGLETSGKQRIAGSLDEILAIVRKVPGVVPVLNFAHIHAREGGILSRKEGFQEVFDRVQKVTNSKSFYCHFAGVEHEGGNERRITPIKKGDMRFEPLAELLLDCDYDVTVISDSPLLEHDAMYMKVILERVQMKRETRALKGRATPFDEFIQKPAKPPVKAIPKVVPKPAVKTAVKKPPPKPAPKPAAKAAPKAVSKPAAKKPVPKPAAKPQPKSAKKPAPKAARKPVTAKKNATPKPAKATVKKR